ncbi:putative nuclease HARBI1 [Aphis craccivora]|uniref:Putative nuclease HARBI1 n=1 Tax=Aphis craccivora TaxID=307492 RepID=A0A6G0YBX7_APHCR|nr:putative nuclease HARBI1 [Aphis craccivora]
MIFRLSKNCVDYLLTLIAEKLETATDRNMAFALAPMNQVLLTLRFYALGTMLISVADMFGVRDSGYALKPYMLTPILNQVGRIEMLYNESQIRTKNIIERCFGVWKRRFPVLLLGMRLQLRTVQAIIVATAILHNICRDMNEDLPEDNSDDVLNQLNEAEDMTETVHRHDDNGEDSITKNSLFYNYFAR